MWLQTCWDIPYQNHFSEPATNTLKPGNYRFRQTSIISQTSVRFCPTRPKGTRFGKQAETVNDITDISFVIDDRYSLRVVCMVRGKVTALETLVGWGSTLAFAP